MHQKRLAYSTPPGFLAEFKIGAGTREGEMGKVRMG